MVTRRKTLLGALAVAVAAVAVTVPLVAAAENATMAWGGCEDNAALRATHPDDIPADLECGELAVPVNWDDPDREIDIPLARLTHTGSGEPQGSVIYLPGGPGAPGSPQLVNARDHLADLRKNFDVVTYDPRGNFYDEYLPVDDCAKTGLEFAAPKTKRDFDRVHGEHVAVRVKCREHDREVFDNINSVNIARDVDAIRDAVGDEKLNALANSYGGTIAQSYARQFPNRVRTMYMDSTGNHLESLKSDEISYLENKEKEFREFTRWCETDSSCALSGEDLSAVWLKLLASADENPIPVTQAEGVSFSGHDLQGNASILVDEKQHWKMLASGIVEAREGDASTIATPSLGMGGEAFVGAPNVTVSCGDGKGYGDWAEYREGRERGRQYSPHFPETRVDHGMFCVDWPTPAVNPYAPLPADELPPMLSAAADTEIPRQQRLTEEVPGSILIEVEGFGHGHYIMHGNTCVIKEANAYFVDGALPDDGTTCPQEE